MALQRKLDVAEGERQRVLDEVDTLQSEIQEARIAFVAKQLDLYERQVAKFAKDPEKYGEFLQTEASLLFLKEREMLHEMIRSGSPTASFEAQQMLDRILRLITDLNDEQRLDSEKLPHRFGIAASYEAYGRRFWAALKNPSPKRGDSPRKGVASMIIACLTRP